MIFTVLKNIKEILTIGSLAAAILFGTLNQINKGRADDAENNLYSKTIQWEDEKGRLVTETTELRYSVNDLKAISQRDSAKLSDAEKVIWEAGQTIKELRSKPQHVVSYSKTEVEALYDSLEVLHTIKDNKLISIEPIRTDHLNIEFEVIEGKVLANAKYNAGIEVIVDRERRKETKRGKKRFFIARWLKPDWQYNSKAVCDDPHATIEDTVHINFDNRK